MSAEELWSDLCDAHNRICPFVHRTPVLTCSAIDRIAGAVLFFKCENFQKVGAFKSRGAYNAIFNLSWEEKRRGVCTHSSGNFAQALACAARDTGIEAYIVMPENAPRVKIAAVEEYGAKIVFCEAKPNARELLCEEIEKETGATFVHPSNDIPIILGQGTAALELFEDVPSLDALVTPVGGGGLISGCAIAANHFGIPIFGAEPAGADDAFRSLAANRIIPSVDPKTICDGLLTSLGSNTFPLIRDNVKEIITVTDQEVLFALKLVFERMKIVIEPSSATVLAAVLKDDRFRGKRVGCVLSGGNIDATRLASLLEVKK